MRNDFLDTVGNYGLVGAMMIANVFVGLFIGMVMDKVLGGHIFTIAMTLLGGFTGITSVCKLALKNNFPKSKN